MFLLLAKITAENGSPTVRALTLAPRRLAVPAACLDLILPPYFPQRRLARLQPGHVQVLRSGNGGGMQVDWKAYLP